MKQTVLTVEILFTVSDHVDLYDLEIIDKDYFKLFLRYISHLANVTFEQEVEPVWNIVILEMFNY